MENKKGIAGGYVFLMAFFGVMFIFLFIFALANNDNSNGSGASLKITNPLQTCEFVDVPYETQEAYTVSEPYQAIEEYKVDLKYEVVSATRSTTLNGFDVWAVGEVSIRNVDSETGTFTVKQTFDTLNGGSKSFQSNKYIMVGETKVFREEYDVVAGEDFNVQYVVTPPKKTMTRTVTKYRDLTKYRTVTKTKMEEICN
jgi:hypothetical protein